MDAPENIINSIRLNTGFDIDLDEGWIKLISSQFGGSPGRAFPELIQNAIDSYPSGTPWEKRIGKIETKGNTISICDYGEGMDTKRLALLATVGGSDKPGDESKLGRFGLGFISIFNPLLRTKNVTVTTICEGHVVEMVFFVADPMKRPELRLRILNTKVDFSTSVSVEFNAISSVQECLASARESLSWYPCPMTINGVLFDSEWYKGEPGKSIPFSEGNCKGLLRKSKEWENIALLCKYEFVMKTSLTHFINGGYNMKYNLRDYEATFTPYIPDVQIVFNVDNLSLVISRDSYYLNTAYRDARKILIRYLREFLAYEIKKPHATTTIIGNQFIFRDELNGYLKDPDNCCFKRKENIFLRLLAEEQVYRINGRPGLYSLKKLKKMISRGNPFWYSTEKSNLRWLGGSFKHDFIVIPDKTDSFSNSSELYDLIFGSVFEDVVNLDNILSDKEKIQNLVDRRIVDKSALSPDCNIIGLKDLSNCQSETLIGLARLLGDRDISDVIGSNLHIPVGSVTPVFFSISEDGAWLSTGIFDLKGMPVSEEYVTNIVNDPKTGITPDSQSQKIDLLLGLNADHPVINFLSGSTTPHKEYYTLTYLAHELALCQKILVPYSPFYHAVSQKLAQEMRRVLMKNLLLQMNN